MPFGWSPRRMVVSARWIASYSRYAHGRFALRSLDALTGGFTPGAAARYHRGRWRRSAWHHRTGERRGAHLSIHRDRLSRERRLLYQILRTEGQDRAPALPMRGPIRLSG